MEEDVEDDVVITGAKGATDRTTSQQGAGTSTSGSIPQNGSGCFVKGLTLPPLSQSVLKLAREKGTSFMANSFGFHMNQVLDVVLSSLLL